MFSIEERKYYVESVLKRIFVFNKVEFDQNFSMEKEVINYLINHVSNEFLEKNKFLFEMIVNYINNNSEPSKNDIQMVLPLKQFLQLVKIEMNKDLNYKIEVKEEIKEEDKFKPIDNLGNIVEEKKPSIIDKIEQKEEQKKTNSPSDKITSLLAKVKDGVISKDVLKDKIEDLDSSKIEEKKSKFDILKDTLKIGSDSISKIINKEKSTEDKPTEEKKEVVEVAKNDKFKLDPINLMEKIIKEDVQETSSLNDIPDYILEDEDFSDNSFNDDISSNDKENQEINLQETKLEEIDNQNKEELNDTEKYLNDTEEELNDIEEELSDEIYLDDDYSKIDVLDYSYDGEEEEEELNFDEEYLFVEENNKDELNIDEQENKIIIDEIESNDNQNNFENIEYENTSNIVIEDNNLEELNISLNNEIEEIVVEKETEETEENENKPIIDELNIDFLNNNKENKLIIDEEIVDEKEIELDNKEEIKLSYSLKELENEDQLNESIKTLNLIESDEYNEPIINDINDLNEKTIEELNISEFVQDENFEDNDNRFETPIESFEHMVNNDKEDVVLDFVFEEKNEENKLDIGFLFEENNNDNINDLIENINIEEEEQKIDFVFEEKKEFGIELGFLFEEEKTKANYENKNLDNSLNDITKDKEEVVEKITKDKEGVIETITKDKEELILDLGSALELTENEKLLLRIEELENRVKRIEELEKRIEELEKR